MEKWEAVFAFHFSMPRISFHFPGRRHRWPVSQRRVRHSSVVVDAPTFSQHLYLPQRVKDLPIQELITQLRVEALAITVLPWRTGFDIQRPGSGVSQPFAQFPGHELGPLSERKCSGIPCSITASANVSIISRLFSLRATQIARHSRVCSSIRFSMRILLGVCQCLF